MFELLLTLFVAFVGGILAEHLKIPAAKMTGAMVFVLILNLVTGKGCFPTDYRKYVQFMSGALVGISITKSDIIRLKGLLIPVVIQIISMLLLNIAVTFAFSYFGNLDLLTSLFSSAPAGVQEMSILSADYGADTTVVSFIQLLRIVFIVSVMPPVYKQIISNYNKTHNNGQIPIPESRAQQEKKIELRYVILTLAVASAGGYLFRFLRIKSGAFLGAIFSSALFSIISGRAELPKKFKGFVQILAGAYIGAQIKPEALKILPALAVPIIVMMVAICLFIVGEAGLLHRISGMDITTCLLISTPGGMQEMSLIAQDYDCDTPVVAAMHVVRVFSTMSLMSILAKWMITLSEI